MPTFDVVSKLNMQEVDNAVNQARKEVETRFDFKGTRTELVLDITKGEIRLATSDDSHLASLTDVLHTKLVKRGISLMSVQYGKVEAATGNSVRQVAKLVQGIEKEKAKELVKLIKEAELKVQAQIMDDQVRVTGKKRDDLQAVIQMLKGSEDKVGIPMQYINFRD